MVEDWTPHPGDEVVIIDGPFADFEAIVESTNEEGKVRVRVSLFGRETPVELFREQIRKMV